MSKHQKKVKINYNYKKTISFIPRGIDTNYFSPKNPKIEQLNSVRSRWGIENNNFVILLPGRLTFWKGQFFFLNTLLFLKQEKLIRIKLKTN